MASARGAGLVAILLLAATLRLLWLDAGWFGVDQARDVTWAQAIASGASVPIAGPLMRGRLRLGAIYYLFWTPPALLGDDPRLAYGYAALLGVAAVGAVYRLASSLAGPRAGLLASLLLATWPAAVLDSRIAWAPAALPPATAAVLLAAHALLRRPTTGRAAATGLLAGLATQLHLAAAPLVAVAAGAVVARARPLGRRGLGAAALAAAAPVATMAIAWAAGAGATIPSPPTRGAALPLREILANRWRHILALGSRVWAGYSPPPSERPLALSLAIRLEDIAVALLLAGALLALASLLRRSRRASGEATPLPEVASLAACFGTVALLPAEAWYYYLDTAVVPGCVLLGAAAARYAPRLRAELPLAGLALARALALFVWLQACHASGLVHASLDLLRLGGSRAADATAPRARLPTIAVKQNAARALAATLGAASDAAIRRHAHGAAFADLDTDNGFFFRQATSAGRPPGPGPHRQALVVYAGELPAEWLAAFSPPERIGPLELYSYEPLLGTAAARIASCGDAPLPPPPPRDPRAYGSGRRVLARWPCAPGPAEIAVPVSGARPEVELRVLARTLGGARVVAVTAAGGEPSEGAKIESPAPGAGIGLRLETRPAELRVLLEVAGPARLDLYELHGRRGD